MDEFFDLGTDAGSVEDIIEAAIPSPTPGLPTFPSSGSGLDSGLDTIPTGLETIPGETLFGEDPPTFGTPTADDFLLGPTGDTSSNFVDVGDGDDQVGGSANIDIIAGGDGNDNLTGGGGDDQMSGGDGDDRLDGGDGDDLLIFGGGRDVGIGGDGGDDFFLDGAGVDDPDLAPRITDFDPTEGDHLLIPDNVNPDDLIYEIDADGNIILRLPNGRILAILEDVDLSELLDFEDGDSPIRAASEQLDDRASGAKDLGLLTGDRTETGELSSRDTYDLFKFRVDQSTLLDGTLTTPAGAEVAVKLYQDANKDGVLTTDEELANTEDDEGTLDSIENYLLKPGEYYLSADLTDDRANNGPFASNYTLNLRGTASGTARDTAGDRFANAVNLETFANKQVNESLSGTDLADIYRLDVPEGNYLDVNLTGDLANQVTLALVTDNNSTGEVEEEELIDFGRNGFSSVGLAGGTYYLVAIADDNAQGSYQLDLEMGGGSPVDNELFQSLFPNDPITGQVSRQSRVNPDNDGQRFEEYLLADVYAGDRVILTATSTDGVPTIQLIDASGDQIKATGTPIPGTNSVRIDFTLPDPRDYVVRVLGPTNQDFNYRLDLVSLTAEALATAATTARTAQDNSATVSSASRRLRNATSIFLGDSVSAQGKKPSPSFGEAELFDVAILDYRSPLTDQLGLLGPNTTDLSTARISDIKQGGLGDCAFLAGVASLFGRMNPAARGDSKAKRPAEVSSAALQSLLKGASGENYTFAFYPKPGSPAEQVTVDSAVLTKQQEFKLFDSETGKKVKFTDGTQLNYSRKDPSADGLASLSVTLPNNQGTLKFFNTNTQAVLSQFKKLDLTKIEGFDATAESVQQPYAAKFSITGSNARSWVNALERGYAAWRENTLGVAGYTAIGNGDSGSNVLQRLTGLETRIYAKAAEIFEGANQALDRGDFVTTGAIGSVADKVGIVGGHAYAVTDAYTLNGEKRIVVYNPHGVDSITTEDAQGQSFYAPSAPYDDGFLDLSLDEFAKYFGKISVTESGKPQPNPVTPTTPGTTTPGETTPGATTPGTTTPGATTPGATTPGTTTPGTTTPGATTPGTTTPGATTPGTTTPGTTTPGATTPGTTTPGTTTPGATTPGTTTPGATIPNVPATPVVPPPSVLQPTPNGVEPATPGEFFTLTPQTDRFQVPTSGTGTLGKVRALGSADNIEGSAGVDEVFANGGLDVVYGRDDDDRLWGGKRGDRLYGNNGNDQLKGQWGDDLLVGGAGNDSLGGGLGNDLLVGSEDTDNLTGGEGADAFVLLSPFATQDLASADRVADFNREQGDRIALTDGLTGADLVLERTDTGTIIRLKSNNAILGVVEGVTPDALSDRFTTYTTALQERSNAIQANAPLFQAG